MEQIISFLVKYWEVILSTVLTLVVLIITIIKKPTVITNRWTEILAEVGNRIPGLVIDAEKQVVGGNNKYCFVIDRALEIAKAINQDDLTDLQAAQVVRIARLQLEQVLNAPTKKGGLGRGS